MRRLPIWPLGLLLLAGCSVATSPAAKHSNAPVPAASSPAAAGATSVTLAFDEQTGCTNSVPEHCTTTYNSAAVDVLTGKTYPRDADILNNGSFRFLRVDADDGGLAVKLGACYRASGSPPQLEVIVKPGADWDALTSAPEGGYQAATALETPIKQGDVVLCKLTQDGKTTYGKLRPTAITRGTSTPSANNGDHGGVTVQYSWNKGGGHDLN